MSVKDVLDAYDRDIDVRLEDARGFHETMTQMERDKILQESGQLQTPAAPPVEVTRNDNDELLDYDEFEESPKPRRKPERRRKSNGHSGILTISIGPSNRPKLLEVINPDGQIVHEERIPVGRPRPIQLKGIIGPHTFRLVALSAIKRINVPARGGRMTLSKGRRR
jgi:hypothetical protein